MAENLLDLRTGKNGQGTSPSFESEKQKNFSGEPTRIQALRRASYQNADRGNIQENPGNEGEVVPAYSLNESGLREDSKMAGETMKKMERRNRVDSTTTFLMLGTAIFFDLAQMGLLLIPFIGWILSAYVGMCAWLTFYIWTSIKGWGLSDAVKNFVVTKILPLTDIVPIINTLPVSTLRVVLQISFLKAEDALYNKTKGKADIAKVIGLISKYSSGGVAGLLKKGVQRSAKKAA